jgi:hypothetical protein
MMMSDDNGPQRGGYAVQITFDLEEDAQLKRVYDQLCEIEIFPLEVLVSFVPRVGERVFISGVVPEGEELGKMASLVVEEVFHTLILYGDDRHHTQNGIWIKCSGVSAESLLLMAGMLDQSDDDEDPEPEAT